METIDTVMCRSGEFYNDRGEIRLHSDTLQKLQKRSSRCDAAITEKEPYFEDCRRQFAAVFLVFARPSAEGLAASLLLVLPGLAGAVDLGGTLSRDIRPSL